MLAVCTTCHRPMNVDSCDPHPWPADGVLYLSPRYGEHVSWEAPDRCNDCGIARGGIHHPPCDQELCPHGQRIACARCKPSALEAPGEGGGRPSRSPSRSSSTRALANRRDSTVKRIDCRHCGASKPPAMFPRNPRKANGRSSWCKECHLERPREWREHNRDEINARRRDRESERTRRTLAEAAAEIAELTRADPRSTTS